MNQQSLFSGCAGKLGLQGSRWMYNAMWMASLATGVFFTLVVALMCRHGAEIAHVDSFNYYRFSQTGAWLDLPTMHGIGYALYLAVFAKVIPSLQMAAAAANVCAAFLFGSLLCLWSLRRFGWKGPGVAWAVLGNYAVLEAYGAALSEGFFLVWLLGAFAGIAIHAKTGEKRWLALSAVCMAAACVTRYAGLAFVGAACLALWLGTAKRTKGFWGACVYGGASILPLGVVMAVNQTLRGNATARSVIFQPAGLLEWGDGCATVTSWFMPDRIWLAMPFLTSLVGGAMLAACLACGIQGIVKRNGERIAWAFAALGHVAFLYLSYTFADCDIVFNRRLLVPMIPFLFWGMACLLERIPRIGQVAFIALFAYLVCFNTYRAIPLVRERFENGSGWWGKQWDRSPTVGRITEISRKMPVYSNAATVLTVRGGENIRGIPWVEQPASGAGNDQFEDEYAALLDSLAGGKSVLGETTLFIWFKRTVQLERIVADAGLEQLETFEDGAIWGRPGVLDGIDGE